MADSHPKQEQPAGSASARGYALPNQASPLPRQWQLPTPQSPPSPQSRAPSGIQHFYPGPAGAGDWRQAAPPRRMERAILLGLWLLVMLAAIATGLSMLDRSAMTPTPTPTPAARPLTSDDAEAMRRAALAAAGAACPGGKRAGGAAGNAAGRRAQAVAGGAGRGARATRGGHRTCCVHRIRRTCCVHAAAQSGPGMRRCVACDAAVPGHALAAPDSRRPAQRLCHCAGKG
jgi:hypothetical protein